MLKKITSLLLFTTYLIGAIFIQPIEVTATNNNPLKLDISTDKAAYKEDEEIHYEIVISNHSMLEANELVLSVELPDDLKVVESDADDGLVWEIDHLAGMEQTSVTFTAKIATGLPWFVYLLLFVLLGAAILVAIIFFRKKRLAKITTLILLAVGLSAYLGMQISAEDNTYRITKASQVVIERAPYDVDVTLEAIIEDSVTLTGDLGINEDNELYFELTWLPQGESLRYNIYRSYTNDLDDFELIAENISKNYQTNDFDINGETYYYVTLAGEEIYSNTLIVDGTVDTDDDGLSDTYELLLGTDRSKVDTDGDGLPDGYEVYQTLTDPLVKDSDQNGRLDGDEDPDQDGLTHLEEFEHGTDPHNPDSDFDGWDDGYELKQGTDPLQSDTDQDGVMDSLEASFGFDPLNPDTDGNGVLDGDELVSYTTETEAIERDPHVNPKVTIKSSASEVDSTTITNMEGTNWFLSEDIPGYLGAPFDFNTEIDFDEAEMTFVYDESIVTDDFRPEIFYYNEAMQRLERLENQTHDPDSQSVTASVEHFSMYLLLNGVIWDAVWEEEIYPFDPSSQTNQGNTDVAFAIDSSGSMSASDPNDLRKKSAHAFTDKLKTGDRAAVVDFDNRALLISELTTDKLAVKAAIDQVDDDGGTHLYRGIMMALEEVVNHGLEDHMKFVVFLTDGEGTWDDAAIDYANDHQVKIFTIGLGSSVDQSLLERIATSTAGKYYHADEAENLEDVFDESAHDIIGCPADRDCDGIPDQVEKDGMRLGNGKIVFTDFTIADTDGDGLLDGEEVTMEFVHYQGGYYRSYSDPTLKDTDKDGIIDSEEAREDRKVYNVSNRTLTHISNLAYVNLESHVSKKISEASAIGNHNHLDELKDEIGDWKIVKANDGGFTSAGFGGVAVKKGHDLVIGYRGTEIGQTPETIYDILADVGIYKGGNNAQSTMASRFASDLVMLYPKSNAYVTGHSLGGFLAQVVSYRIVEQKLHQVYFTSTSNRAKVKEVLADGNFLERGVTFNAAPFFYPTYFHDAGLGWITTVVPIWDLSSHAYDYKIFNYSIEGDFLQLAVDINVANKFGQVMPAFTKMRDENAHSLVQFYDHFPKYD